MSIILGIDFGTTKSVVGTWIENKPFIIPCKNGQLSIPSEILVQGSSDEQKVLVGWDARNKNKYSEDSFLVNAVKRSIGKSNFSKEKWWYVYPQYTISYILAELKSMAEDFFNQDISDAVIAIPSHFDINQRKIILEAANIAGLNVIRLINEATASAISYSTKHPEEQVVMIIDIGGGTTDVAIVEISDNIYEVLHIDGDTNIGGIDFNIVLYNWFINQLSQYYGITKPVITKSVEVIINHEIERVKIELAENRSSIIYLPWLSINGIYLNKEFKITQNEFRNISKKITAGIADVIDKTLNNFDRHIDTYLLTGGASKTFGIKEIIEKQFNISCSNRGISIETSVAKGAIIQSCMLDGKLNKVVLDCVQDNYGIALQNGTYEIFLYKNSTIPVAKIKEFSTTVDNQTEIKIKVYKGKDVKASENKFLGFLKLSNLPLSPKDTLVIVVKFYVDVNMDISITAKIKDNDKIKVKTTLDSGFGLPIDLLTDMHKKVDIWKLKRKLRLY